MNLQEARELGDRISRLVADSRIEDACGLLFPVLAERTPFRLLDAIGEGMGHAPLVTNNVFLD